MAFDGIIRVSSKYQSRYLSSEYDMKNISVVAGVIWNAGRFLAARRHGCRNGAGFWEFPGGKIEPGESKEAALSRELKEELGIVVQDFHFWKTEEHTYADYRVTLYFFHVTAYLNAPALIEGHDALAWVRPKKCGQYRFLPADTQILIELKQNYPFGPCRESEQL